MQATAAADVKTKPQAPAESPLQVQSAGFYLELSSDWLILRASENIHRFLGEYHVRLIGEHLSSYTLAQALHDLRNTLARQRSSLGIARAYRVRLIDEPRYFDFAFQQLDGRILLEGVDSPEDGFGVWMGSISRLIDGLGGADRSEQLDQAARRLRALGGFDRVTARLKSGEFAESNRGTIEPSEGEVPPLPAIICDTGAQPVPVFPRGGLSSMAAEPLLQSPSSAELDRLRARHIGSALRLPMRLGDEELGEFRCQSRSPRPPALELHAAGELFAQIVALKIGGD